MPARKSRQQRLDHTITVIQQRHGPQALRQGVAPPTSVPHLSTGFPQLDEALGIGGIPRGKITVLTGAATSGKRTLAALLLARAQGHRHRPVAYVDVDHTCNPDYLERCGVHLPQLLVARPSDGRQALDMALSLAERREWAAIVFDHWGALAADAATQRHAVAALDHLGPRLAHSGVTLVVLDEPVSPWQGLLSALGNGSAASALGHHAAVRLALRHEDWFWAGADVRGYRVQVQVQKNKLAPAGKTVSLDIRFNGTVRGDGL